MKSFIQLSIQEYESLKRQAERQDIPVKVLRSYADDYSNVVCPIVHKVVIDMRELKLQVCKQQGVDPRETVEFYWSSNQ